MYADKIISDVYGVLNTLEIAVFHRKNDETALRWVLRFSFFIRSYIILYIRVDRSVAHVLEIGICFQCDFPVNVTRLFDFLRVIFIRTFVNQVAKFVRPRKMRSCHAPKQAVRPLYLYLYYSYKADYMGNWAKKQKANY